MGLFRHARRDSWRKPCIYASGTAIKADSRSFVKGSGSGATGDFHSPDPVLGIRRSPQFMLPTNTIEPLWLNHQNKPRWVNSRLAVLDPAVQGDQQFRFVGPSTTPGDEFRRLCEEGQVDKALGVLSNMKQEGSVRPSVNDYACLLMACTKRKALAQAKRVLAYMSGHGLQSIMFLGEYVVSTLVKCGGLDDAIEVFNRLPHRTTFSWTAMISGYITAGNCQEALILYQRMQDEGFQPNKYILISLLKSCCSVSGLEEGKQIHAEALKYSWETDLFVATCLVEMYAKYGSIVDAQNVFDKLSQRDAVVWNSLLAAYMQNGQAEKALQLHEQMREEGVSPSIGTFVSAIQACGMLAEKVEGVACHGHRRKSRSLEKGKLVHLDARSKGYDSNAFVASSLISMYGKCGSPVDAENVFNRLSMRDDVVLWNAMLAVYVQQGHAEKGLELFDQMQDEGVSADVRTLVSVLQAWNMLVDKERDGVLDAGFSQGKFLEKAKVIQTEALRKGLDSDAFLGSALVTMYGKCGNVDDAWAVFHGLSQQNVVPWNAIIAVCAQNGLVEKALQLYEHMRKGGVKPNNLTFVTVLQACGMLGEEEEVENGQHCKANVLKRGKAIHADAWANGYNSDALVGSTLISMYGKCGSIEDAVKVFDGLLDRDVVSWTAMLAAYARQGQVQSALKLYRQMQDEGGVSPDNCALMSVLQLCSDAGGLDICRQIHHKLVSTQRQWNSLLASYLIHAYGKCASMLDAQKVFDSMQQHDVVSWTALIAGYARQGSWLASLQSYEEMRRAGIEPNAVTFLSLLSVCSHAGLVDNGIEYFKAMSRDYGITPEIEHYATMVDLLGRAGYFTQVQELLSTMPLQPNLAIWLCMLGACRKHGKVGLARQAFDRAVLLQPKNAATYLLMSNIYADAGLWDFANKVKELSEKRCTRKKPGQSWIEHKQEVHFFLAGYSNHQQQDRLYTLISEVSS